MKKNKYYPIEHKNDTELSKYCPYCEALNRHREDIRKELFDDIEFNSIEYDGDLINLDDSAEYIVIEKKRFEKIKSLKDRGEEKH